MTKTIVKGIRLALQDSPRKEWTTLLKDVVQNYNNTIHENTGFTPSYLLFGTDNLNTSKRPLTEALQSAKVCTEGFKLRKKQAYDQTHHPLNLNVGDWVKRRIPSRRPDVKKLTPKDHMQLPNSADQLTLWSPIASPIRRRSWSTSPN